MGIAGHCAHAAKPADGGAGGAAAPPERETRLALLQQLAALRDIELPEPVGQLLADGLSGTARDLAGVLLELAMPDEFPAHGVCRLHWGPLTWRRPGNILRVGTAAGRRAYTRLPWPRRGISRCGYRT